MVKDVMRMADRRDAALPLMLLPGTLCDARVFAPMLAVLGDVNAIVGDMHGASTVAELAARLLATAPPRFALLGFSLGGIVALEIAARAPDRVAGLALIDTHMRDVPEDRHAARRAVASEAHSAAALVGETLWPCYVAPGRLADEPMRALVMAMAADCPADATILQTELALSRVDSRPRLATLHMPSLVLAGALDGVAPADMQKELAGGPARFAPRVDPRYRPFRPARSA